MGVRASEITTRIVRDLDDEGRLLWIPESKTEAGRRVLRVPEELRPYLLELAEGKKATDLLFGYHDRAWPRRWVQRICGQVGVPVVTAHGMRGTHSTVALDFGQTPLVVAAALGHESPSTTLGNYAAPGAGAAARQARVATVLNGDLAQRNAQRNAKGPELPLRPFSELPDFTRDSVELNGIEPSAS
jgi:integrase